jgi:hypothetical protein
MQVQGIDERHMIRERDGAAFVVFVYYGGGGPLSSWAVDSRLITDADLPQVLRWLTANLPADCCWSLGFVRDPAQPTAESHVDVRWIVGSDVLNVDPSDRSPDQQRIAEEMLARRHRVSLLQP